MSFLGSGAECSTSSNPLSQVLSKQFEQDKSLQRDRSRIGNNPNQFQNGMRTGNALNANHDQKVNDTFFRGQPQPNGIPNGFEMRPPPQLHQPQHQHQHHDNSWTGDFQKMNLSSAPAAQLSQDEVARMENVFRHAPPQIRHQWQNEFNNNPAQFQQHFQQFGPEHDRQFASSFLPSMMHGSYGGMSGMSSMGGMNMHHLNQPIDQAQNQNAKGKGKLTELDDTKWEEQFKQFEQDEEAIQNKTIDEELNRTDDDNTRYFGDFESIWKGIQAENAQNGTTNPHDWTNDFVDFESNGGFNPFEQRGKPDLGDYIFEPNNKFLDHPDPYSEGVKIMESGGNLSEAALMFEAACQNAPERGDAWTMLGLAQAQNEKEEPAIRALEKAANIDDRNLAALMGLAVSYTNEGYETAAYISLEQWLFAKYPQITNGTPPQDSSMQNRTEVHARVTDLFLKAARANGPMDADVQVGLGVLFYGDEEYDKAVDCFVAALKSRPDDHLLWNRLGATLANSNRSEEAIDAYHKALDLKPSFVRARYNLGVSCINIGCYDEAAQHLLRALKMHAVDGGRDSGVNISSNLWDTLRRVFIVSDRKELADKAVHGADVNIFREYGIDF